MIKKIKNNLLYILITILSLIPVIFWIKVKPLGLRFISVPIAFTSIGQVTGLVGMALFSIAMALNIKSNTQKKIFGAQKVYLAHHFFGGLSFILILFHPILLAINYMFVSANSAALLLLPSKDWSINYGIISLILMILFLLITFYTKIMGKLFKSTHKYLGLAFILAILHTFLITSDISRIHGLKIYMWILTILGLMVYSYFSIFKFDKKNKEINA